MTLFIFRSQRQKEEMMEKTTYQLAQKWDLSLVTGPDGQLLETVCGLIE